MYFFFISSKFDCPLHYTLCEHSFINYSLQGTHTHYMDLLVVISKYKHTIKLFLIINLFNFI